MVRNIVHFVLVFLFLKYFGYVWSDVSSHNKVITILPSHVHYVNKSDAGVLRMNNTKKISASELNGTLWEKNIKAKLGASLMFNGHDRVNKKQFDSEPRVDGNWGNWGQFGPCSQTCDEGIRERRRSCNNPAPRNGGKDCPKGGDVEKSLCEMGRCYLKSFDTEFRNGQTGIWKSMKGTPGFQWKIHHFDTTTHNITDNDATGDGFYISADISPSRKPEDTANIISEIIPGSAQVNRLCLKFQYNMHGSAIGILSVKIKRQYHTEKKILDVVGHGKGHEWSKRKVTLKSSVPFQVIFSAVIGPASSSNIALDNIYIDSGRCKCQDRYQSCPKWAKNGDCLSNYLWMADRCKKSCNTCDCNNRYVVSDRCNQWARRGYCTLGGPWMSVNCRRSCKLCDCNNIETFDNCQRLVEAGDCKTNMKWMMSNCKLSCGFCECKDVAEPSMCKKWFTGGECDRNPKFMSWNCRLSCGLCNCWDKSVYCKTWASHGECEKTSKWMTVNCALSCGKCNKLNIKHIKH